MLFPRRRVFVEQVTDFGQGPVFHGAVIHEFDFHWKQPVHVSAGGKEFLALQISAQVKRRSANIRLGGEDGRAKRGSVRPGDPDLTVPAEPLRPFVIPVYSSYALNRR
jgi:hypothetical protein